MLRLKKFKDQTLILIGYKASGKTTLGRMLAHHFNFQFLDTDALFEKTYGIKPEHYYQQYGEEAFRGQESNILQNLSGLPRTIIATGGGVIENALNIEYLKKIGMLVFLHVEFDKIINRLEQLGRIPSFVHYQHFKARAEKYKLACDQMIHLSFDSIDKSFNQLLEELGVNDGE